MLPGRVAGALGVGGEWGCEMCEGGPASRRGTRAPRPAPRVRSSPCDPAANRHAPLDRSQPSNHTLALQRKLNMNIINNVYNLLSPLTCTKQNKNETNVLHTHSHTHTYIHTHIHTFTQAGQAGRHGQRRGRRGTAPGPAVLTGTNAHSHSCSGSIFNPRQTTSGCRRAVRGRAADRTAPPPPFTTLAKGRARSLPIDSLPWYIFSDVIMATQFACAVQCRTGSDNVLPAPCSHWGWSRLHLMTISGRCRAPRRRGGGRRSAVGLALTSVPHRVPDVTPRAPTPLAHYALQRHPPDGAGRRLRGASR